MREIKFRAWDKELKVMLEMDIKETQVWFGDTNNFSQILLCSDRFVIMQYTGLKDKNGKEIYEGDIVQWDHRKDKIRSTVAWGHVGFWIVGYLDLLGSIVESINANPYNIEVIGNTYEDPNLLNKLSTKIS